ncbi:MAG: DUF3833 family protein [Roseibium sp.]
MMFPFRILSIAALTLIIFTVVSSNQAFAAKPLVLEEFFRGKTIGKGVFESKIAGINRSFTVYLNGTWNRKTSTLRLREDFVYEDGERDTKTWFFEKLASGGYIGQRADVKGPTIVRVGDDGALRFSYVADVPTEKSSILLRFDDTLEQVDRRTVRNTAHVVKSGFPIGTVSLVFTK